MITVRTAIEAEFPLSVDSLKKVLREMNGKALFESTFETLVPSNSPKKIFFYFKSTYETEELF